jgi:hypothetical protein
LQALQHELRKALGRAHHVRGIDRLVGRDQHEGFDVCFERRFPGMPRGKHVVVDALDHVLLDDRHVLVSGRVIHGLHRVRLHDLAHAVLVMRVAEERDDFERQTLARRDETQLFLDVVERELRHFEQQQARRRQANDLATELGTDRTTGACHQHRLALDRRAEQRLIGRHGVAAEQIADVDLVNLVDA